MSDARQETVRDKVVAILAEEAMLEPRTCAWTRASTTSASTRSA